jgi:hypothetical protein
MFCFTIFSNINFSFLIFIFYTFLKKERMDMNGGAPTCWMIVDVLMMCCTTTSCNVYMNVQ